MSNTSTNNWHIPHKKYTSEDILVKANMFLAGYNLKRISNTLNTPISTVSWHLIYPLKEIDYATWMRVRDKLDKYAKNKSRVTHRLIRRIIHMYKEDEK